MTVLGPGAGDVPLDGDEPGGPRGRAARRRRRRRPTACSCTSARASPSPAAWPAAPRTPPPRCSPATRCGRPASTRAELLDLAAELGVGRAVRPARRHGDRHWARATELTPALAPRRLPLGVRARRTAACPPRASTASSTGSARAAIRPEPRVPTDLMQRAARRRRRTPSAPLLANDLQPAAVSLLPAAASARSTVGERVRRARRASCPAPGPPSRSSPATASTRSTCRVALTASGCRARGARVHGPVHGARICRRQLRGAVGAEALMAHLLNAEGVTVAFAHARPARTASPSASTTATGSASWAATATASARCCAMLAARAGARLRPGDARAAACTSGMLDQSDELDRRRDRACRDVVGDLPDHVWAARRRASADVLGRPRSARRPRWRRRRSRPLSGGQRRRVALGARCSIDDRRRDAARRADQPPRRRGRRLAGRHLRTRWPASRGALVVVTHDRWFLDAVCERTWEVHDGVVDALRRRVRGVRARARRARPDRRRDRGAAAEPAAQGARLAAARARRRGRASRRFRIDAAARPDRRRAARRATGWRWSGWPRPGSARTCSTSRTSPLPARDDRGSSARRHLAARAGGAGRHRRRQRRRARPRCCGCSWASSARPPGGSSAGKTVRTAMLTQEVASSTRSRDLRVQEAVEKVRRLGAASATAT